MSRVIQYFLEFLETERKKKKVTGTRYILPAKKEEEIKVEVKKRFLLSHANF